MVSIVSLLGFALRRSYSATFPTFPFSLSTQCFRFFAEVGVCESHSLIDYSSAYPNGTLLCASILKRTNVFQLTKLECTMTATVVTPSPHPVRHFGQLGLVPR